MLPLANFYINSPMYTTMLAAELSSKQSTTVVGTGNLFYSNAPL
jgi:hypothetical protein